MPNYDEIIIQSEKNVTDLGKQLKEFEKLRIDIQKAANSNDDVAEKYNQLYINIGNVSQKYTENLGELTQTYLKGSNEIFIKNVSQFQENISQFKKEISRLSETNFTDLFLLLRADFMEKTTVDLAIEYDKFDKQSSKFNETNKKLVKEIDRLQSTDFNELFSTLQSEFMARTTTGLTIEYNKFDKQSKALKVGNDKLTKEIDRLNTDFKTLFGVLQDKFITNTKKDLSVEYKKLDAQSVSLKTINGKLSSEIKRLEQVDIEKLFNRLQKTLSDIFQSFNSINLTLTSMTRNLSDITQDLNSIKTDLRNNQTELLDKLKEYSSLVETKFEGFTEKLDDIRKENAQLKSGLSLSRNILGGGIILIFLLLIYLIIKV